MPGGPMGGPRRGQTTAKAKDFKNTTKKLIKSYLAKYKLPIIVVIIFAIGSTIFTIVGPKILGNATTEIFNGLVSKLSGGAGIDFGKVGMICLGLLGLYAISALFAFVQRFVMTNVTQKITYKLRNDVAIKINKLPMRYFDKKTNGEVLSIITNDIDTLSMNLNQSITEIITSICTIIGILVMMLSISWQMTLISLIILPIAGILVSFIVRKSQKYFIRQQDYLGHVNGQVEEIYSGLNIVKVFNAEGKVTKDFEKANNELYHSGWKSQFLSGLMFPVMNFISNVGYVAVAVAGGYLAVQGTITVGNIQSFIQYNKQFTQPINQLAQISNMLQAMIAAAERIFEFLEEKEEIITAKGNIDTSKLKGNVEFKHVKFGYDEGRTIINDFNASIYEGQKIAIVGPTGARKNYNGKTTYEILWCNFWRNRCRLKENIKYSKEDATDAEVIEAAKAAHVHHFIKTLPNGYNSVINEESSNISAGQKQLLTIARVILANPKILILDEATSSIDTRTEIQIQSAMDNLMKGRTSFIIAHRLSTIKNADLILVMNHGDIVEQGTHEELLSKNGFYADLYNSQFDELWGRKNKVYDN